MPINGLQGQETVNVYVQNVTQSIDDEVAVNILVDNFENVGGVQFSLEWNPDELSFVSVDNLALNASTSSSFNIAETNEGRIGYVHADMSLIGFDLPNGASLFTINFNAVGPDNAIYGLNFGSMPTAQVVADTAAVTMDATFMNGTVTVGMPSEVANTDAGDPRFTVSPNPFEGVAAIRVTELGAGPATLLVFNTEGRQVMEKSIELDGKEQFVQISAADLRTAGVYLLKLSTERGNYSRKLVFRGSGR